MKRWLFVMILLVLGNLANAQCKQKWLRYNHSKSDTIIVTKDQSPSAILDISGMKIRKTFLDSVITFLEAKENRKKENNAMFSDSKIFHHGFTEVVLRTVTRTSPDTNAIKLYNFLLSEGFNGNDWDPDLYYFFTYTKKYGVVHKNHWDKNMDPDLYFKEIFLSDECVKSKTILKDRQDLFQLMFP